MCVAAVAGQLCVSVRGHSDLFCYGASASAAATATASSLPSSAPSSASPGDGWVDLPLVLTGRHVLTIHHITSEGTEAENTATPALFFIRQVPSFPSSSWRWSEVVYPSYGAIIDSRRLLIKLKSNAAMLHSPQQLLIRLTQVRDLVYDPAVDMLDTLGQTAIEPGGRERER